MSQKDARDRTEKRAGVRGDEMDGMGENTIVLNWECIQGGGDGIGFYF